MAEIRLKITGILYGLFPDYEKTKKGSEEQVSKGIEWLDELDKKRPVVTLMPEPDNPHDPYAILAWCGGKPLGHVASEQISEAYCLFDTEHEMVMVRIVEVEVKRKGNLYVVAELPEDALNRKRVLPGYEDAWKQWKFELPEFLRPQAWKSCRVEEFGIKCLFSNPDNMDVEELMRCVNSWIDNSLHDFSKEAMQTRKDYIDMLSSIGDKRLESYIQRLKRQFGAIVGGHRMIFRLEWLKKLEESAEMELYWDKFRSGRKEDNLYKDLQTIDLHLRRMPDGLYANIGNLKVLFSALRYHDVPRTILWHIYTLLLLRQRLCRELGIDMKPLPMDAYGVETEGTTEERPIPKIKETKASPKTGDNEKLEAKSPFYDIVQHDNPEKLVERLHQLIDGRKGADVGCVLLKCMLDGLIIRKPKQREFESEFTLLGGWTSIHKYMDDNNENALDRANKIIIF